MSNWLTGKLILVFTSAALAVTGVSMMAAGCLTPEEREIIYENETVFILTVEVDGTEFTLMPGEEQGFAQRRHYLPDQVRAFDEKGTLVFDEVITWEQLKADGFRVSIR